MEKASSVATPSLQGKQADVEKLTKSPTKIEKHKLLKRTTAADPYASESGTDTGTGRKKPRKNAPGPVANPALTSTSLPTPSPSLAFISSTPNALGHPPKIGLVTLKIAPGNLAQVAASANSNKKRPRDGGAGSDNGNVAAEISGGETLPKKAKIKLKVPQLALAVANTNPAEGRPRVSGVGSVRAASPSASASRSTTPAPNGGPPSSELFRIHPYYYDTDIPISSVDITADEVRAVLNLKPEGQELKEFLSHFKGRVDKNTMSPFLALLRPLSRQKGKLICPK